MDEVGHESGLISTRHDGDGSPDSFLSCGDWLDQQLCAMASGSDIPSRPSLIAVSRVATKSWKAASTLSNPDRTSMMSELGLVYFLVKTMEKKTVSV